jgi:hypothetical protein
MLKKQIRTTFTMTLLVVSTLIISGCTHSPSATPVSTIQKNFTNEFDVDVLTDAITKAAIKNDWDIIDPTSKSINLKKTYIIKKRELSALRTKRWYKPGIQNDMYVKIDVNKKIL